MNKRICFDMDGTLVNLYSVDNWCERLRSFDPTPYEIAKPLINMSLLARLLNKVQKAGYEIVVISWLSMDSTPEYDTAVTSVKLAWLRKHLPSVEFNNIEIVPFGVDKSSFADSESILFDDNADVRENFVGKAYTPNEIIDILKELV